MRNYTLSLPKAYNQYGASLGRREYKDFSRDESLKFHLNRVHLDSGGYDAGGAYWGIGAPLYCAEVEDRDVRLFFRAADRAGAKTVVLKLAPNARFYR